MNSPDPSSFWYHCGRCGHFFRSVIDGDGSRVCSECGLNPSHDQWRANAAGATLPPPRREGRENDAGSSVVLKSRRRRNKTVWLVLCVWLSFLGGLFWLGRTVGEKRVGGDRTVEGEAEWQARLAKDRSFLQDQLPQVFPLFGGYVVSATPEQRSQFVMDPIRVSPRMVRHFAQNPVVRLDPANLRRKAFSVISVDAGKGIEALWQVEEEIYETVFFRDDEGVWKLDWEHFVRYSDLLFSVFLAGGGPEEGEFRLYARERLAKDRAGEPEMSLTLYAPVVGNPRMVGVASPEVRVPRDHQIGKLLSAAFRLRSEGKRPFGSYLPNYDSDDLIRIRATLRRHQETDEEGKRGLEIVDLHACHWMGVVNEVGVELDEVPENQE